MTRPDMTKTYTHRAMIKLAHVQERNGKWYSLGEFYDERDAQRELDKWPRWAQTKIQGVEHD